MKIIYCIKNKQHFWHIMHQLLILAIIFVISCSALVTTPLGAPYQALSRSGYCTGTANITIVAPYAGTVFVLADSTPIQYGVNITSKQFAFDLGAGGKQFTFENGTYEYIPVPAVGFVCYYFPQHTFDYEKISKSTAVRVPDDKVLFNNYFGLVKDAGAGFSDVAITITEDVIFGFPRVVSYSQKLPKQVSLGQCADPTLTAARLLLPNCVANPPGASFFQLPSACLGANIPLWTESYCF